MKPLFAALVLFAAVAEAQTIVSFGDSVTAPRGDTYVYSAILTADLLFEGKPVTVHNGGIGSSTSAMGLKRFEADVLTIKPDVAIIMFGINDAAIDVWKDPPPRASLWPTTGPT